MEDYFHNAYDRGWLQKYLKATCAPWVVLQLSNVYLV